MSARRFRHRDRQQVRPGLPQLRPGLEAHCPASGFGNPAFCAPYTAVRRFGLPAAYTSEIKYPVFPTSGAAGRLASGMKKSDMKKGNPGRRGYFFSGRAIDSRIDVSAMMFFIL